MLFGQVARRAAMSRIIPVHLGDRAQYFIGRSEREKAFPSGKKSAEPCLLRENGTAGCKITGAAIAEPAALRNDVTAFGDAELGLRALDEFAVAPGRADALHWIKQFPVVLPQRLHISF